MLKPFVKTSRFVISDPLICHLAVCIFIQTFCSRGLWTFLITDRWDGLWILECSWSVSYQPQHITSYRHSFNNIWTNFHSRILHVKASTMDLFLFLFLCFSCVLIQVSKHFFISNYHFIAKTSHTYYMRTFWNVWKP